MRILLLKMIVVIGIALGTCVQLNAQNLPRHEIGLRLTGLDKFDFIYKQERASQQFFRHRIGLINFRVDGKDNHSNFEFGLGYAFGIEKRKVINEKLKFIHGFEPRISSLYSSADGNTTGWEVQLGLGYVLGFQYDFAESFYLGVETVPAVTYARQLDGPNKRAYRFDAGFNSGAVAVVLAYRF